MPLATNIATDDPDHPGIHNAERTQINANETALATKVESADITDIVKVTQATYDGLTPDANTLYLIVG